MSAFIVEKSVAEKLKIGLVYRPPDVDDENHIVTAIATVSPPGLTLVGDVAIDGQEVTQMIQGGAAGTEYLVQFTVTTFDGSIYANPNIDAIKVRVI